MKKSIIAMAAVMAMRCVAAAPAAAVQEAAQLSKRLIDAPIVRSSKGCIAFLGEDKDGLVTVSVMRGPDGKPACVKDMPYLNAAQSK